MLVKRKELARKALKELHKLSELRFVSAYDFAIIYVVWVRQTGVPVAERACEERSFLNAHEPQAEPRLDRLRLDPRFQELVRRVVYRLGLSWLRARTSRTVLAVAKVVGGPWNSARQVKLPILPQRLQPELSRIENETWLEPAKRISRCDGPSEAVW